MASAGGIRAGRAFVELYAQDQSLLRALDNAQSRVRQFAGVAAKAAVAVTAGRLTDGAIGKIANLVADTAGRAGDVDLLAKRFGVTTEEVSRLAYAFEQQGVGMEGFKGTLDGLASSLSAAADGADDSFRRIGLNAKSLIRLPLPQALDQIVDGLGRITLEEDRVKFANEHGLGALLPILAKGSAGLRELGQEADRVGATLSGEQAAKGRQTMLEYTRTWQAVKYAVLEAGLALIPSTQRIGQLGDLVRGLVAVLRAAGQQARDWAAEVYDSLTRVGGAFHEVAKAADETWGGIVAAVKKGDLELAFKVAAAGTKAIWYEMLTAMGKAFKEWIERHRDDLVTVGAILGGVRGAKLGGRLGVWGALVGGGLGAAGGGVAAGEIADRLARLGDTADAEKRAAEARAELAGLAKRAGGGGAAGGLEGEAADRARFEEEMRKRMQAQLTGPELFKAVKGTFAVAGGGLGQQLGYGDSVQRKIVDGVGKIAANAAKIPDVIEAVNDVARMLAFK